MRFVRFLHWLGHERAIGLVNVQVRLASALGGRDLESGVLHPERLADMTLEVAVEWLAACELHQPSDLVDAAPVGPPAVGIEEQRTTRQALGLAGDRVIAHRI